MWPYGTRRAFTRCLLPRRANRLRKQISSRFHRCSRAVLPITTFPFPYHLTITKKNVYFIGGTGLMRVEDEDASQGTYDGVRSRWGILHASNGKLRKQLLESRHRAMAPFPRRENCFVLCVGGDQKLLETRAHVVETTGASAVVVSDKKGILEALKATSICAAIIGRSFSQEEQRNFISIIREHVGEIPVLTLGQTVVDPAEIVTFVLTAIGG
jgi:hypothetical protein